MMFRHYHHGHSILVGAVIGLLLAQHVFVVACIALAVGIVMGRAWAFSVDAAAALRMRLTRTPKRSMRVADPLYTVPRRKL